MEGPGRLAAGIGATLGLAAFSVYLLTQPATVPPSPSPPFEAAGVGPDVVAALGRDFGNVVSAAVGAVNVGLMYLLMRSLGIERTARVWLAAAFGFGTAHWWAAASGGLDGTAHTAAVMLCLLALLVALFGRWPLVCGLLLGTAAVARLPVALAYPLLLALYVARPAPRLIAGDRLVLAAVLATGVLLPLVALGYTGIGPLDLDNIPRQLHAAVLRSLDLVPGAPWFRPSWTAASLLLTTPLYLWLLHAKSASPAVRWAWVAVGLVAALTLLSESVGAPQLGYQPSLDAAPFLFLLLGWVFRNGMTRAACAAVVIGVVVTTYGMVAVGVLDPPFAGW